MADMSRDPFAFAMGYVADSDKYRSQFVDRQREILANYMLEPEAPTAGRERSPYRQGYIHRSRRNQIVLKDPETHKLVATYVAKLALALFSDPRGEHIQAEPVGYEDAVKGRTVTRLLRYAFGLPGHFRAFVEGLTDMVLYGTSVLEVYWRYEEREMPVRSVTSQYGQESSSETRVTMPVFDDVCIRAIDIQDFYPDPSRPQLQEMPGAAKRFRMNGFTARRMARSGIYTPSAVEAAIGRGVGGAGKPQTATSDFKEGYDRPQDSSAPTEFKDMIGYEYWGEVPWEMDGISRRVITVLNGELVRSDPFPLADPMLPFHSLVINPMAGRFYGLGPGEVARYDQSFADALKILLAEAVIRQVHPPIAYDPDADVDSAAIRKWDADALIACKGGPAAIGTVKYDANIVGAMGLMQEIKRQISEVSGALGGIRGEPGPSREAASVGVKRLEYAMDQPELAALTLERDCLPWIGKAVLSRYQQFLGDTDDLKRRVGEDPEPVWIGDIMGEFDVRFVGSRQAMSRQMKLQAYDRLTAMSASVPAFMALIPWQEIGRELIGDTLELPEVAAKIGNPQSVLMNTLLSRVLGQGGPAGNGVASSPQPAGALPAEMAGGVQ